MGPLVAICGSSEDFHCLHLIVIGASFDSPADKDWRDNQNDRHFLMPPCLLWRETKANADGRGEEWEGGTSASWDTPRVSKAGREQRRTILLKEGSRFDGGSISGGPWRGSMRATPVKARHNGSGALANRTQRPRKEKNREEEEMIRKMTSVLKCSEWLPLKISLEGGGRGEGQGDGGRRKGRGAAKGGTVGGKKSKQAFYNFEKKAAVKREAGKYLLRELVVDHCVRCGALLGSPAPFQGPSGSSGAPSRAGLIITGLGPLKCLTNIVSPKRTD